MSSHYNRVAGRNLERLTALSDGIFSVAMTLLVLDLRVPMLHAIHNSQPVWTPGAIQSEQVLWTALLGLSPRLLTYLMSFLTLGIFWLAQQTQLDAFKRSDRSLTWLQLVFLFAVSLMPFSTSLLAEFMTFHLAFLAYWLNLLLLGTMLLVSWRYAIRADLVDAAMTPDLRSAMTRRIVTYQALYALGALLGLVSTFLGIAFIVLLQLISVLAPRLRWLERL